MDMEEYIWNRRRAIGLDTTFKSFTFDYAYPESAPESDIEKRKDVNYSDAVEPCCASYQLLYQEVADALELVSNITGMVEADFIGRRDRSKRSSEQIEFGNEDRHSSMFRAEQRFIQTSINGMIEEETRCLRTRYASGLIRSQSTVAMSNEDFIGNMAREQMKEQRLMILEDSNTRTIRSVNCSEVTALRTEDGISEGLREITSRDRIVMLASDLYGLECRESSQNAAKILQARWRSFSTRKALKNVSRAAIIIQTQVRKRRRKATTTNLQINPLALTEEEPPNVNPFNSPRIDYVKRLLLLDNEYINSCDELVAHFETTTNYPDIVELSLGDEKEAIPNMIHPETPPVSRDDTPTIMATSEDIDSSFPHMENFIRVGFVRERRRLSMIRKNSIWH